MGIVYFSCPLGFPGATRIRLHKAQPRGSVDPPPLNLVDGFSSGQLSFPLSDLIGTVSLFRKHIDFPLSTNEGPYDFVEVLTCSKSIRDNNRPYMPKSAVMT